MFATALNPIRLQSVTGQGLSPTAREFDFENCLITNEFVMEFFFTCGIITASGSIYNQIIWYNKLKSGNDFDELRNLFFNQMGKIPIPDAEREPNYTHHIVRFASSVIRNVGYAFIGSYKLFRKFSIDPKANRQPQIACMFGKAFSAWHEKDEQKAQLFMALVGHYVREELPGHLLQSGTFET